MYNNLPIEGNLLAITEIPTQSPFHVNELATSTPLNTPRLFLVFTTQGLTVLVKQRPLDMLQNLVMTSGCNIRRQPTTFKGFFDYFGVTQASSLCFGMIGLADSSTVNGNDRKLNIYSDPSYRLQLTLTLSSLQRLAGRRFGEERFRSTRRVLPW